MALSPDTQESVLQCLSKTTQQRSYAPDQHIIYEGENCEAAYFILNGTVRVYKLSPQGRQQILVDLSPGQAVNTVPAFQNPSINAASAMAMTHVTLLILYKDDIGDAVKSCPDLALVIIHDFAERLSHLSNLAGDLALLPVRARLARFLLDEIATAQTVRLTHEEIAAHIGSVREVVSRTMRDFVKQGLISKDRQRLVIVDPQLLREKLKVFDSFGPSDVFLYNIVTLFVKIACILNHGG